MIATAERSEDGGVSVTEWDVGHRDPPALPGMATIETDDLIDVQSDLPTLLTLTRDDTDDGDDNLRSRMLSAYCTAYTRVT